MNKECLKALREYEDEKSLVYHKSFHLVWIEENFSVQEIKEAKAQIKLESKDIRSRYNRLMKPKPKPAPTLESAYIKRKDGFTDLQFDRVYANALGIAKRSQAGANAARLRALAMKKKNEVITRGIESGYMSTDWNEYLHHPDKPKKIDKKDNITRMIEELIERNKDG